MLDDLLAGKWIASGVNSDAKYNILGSTDLQES